MITRIDVKLSYAKNTMFIRHQILWTIRVNKNTSLRSIRLVYTEWKRKKKRKKHENSTLELKSTTVSVLWSHPPCITHPHTHVSLISVSLWEGVLALLLTWKGTEDMGPHEVHTGPVWNQNSDISVSKYSLMSKQKVWPVAWSRRGLRISSPTTSTL